MENKELEFSYQHTFSEVSDLDKLIKNIEQEILDINSEIDNEEGRNFEDGVYADCERIN